MNYDDWKLETPEEKREHYARLWRRDYRDPDHALEDMYEKEREELDTYGEGNASEDYLNHSKGGEHI